MKIEINLSQAEINHLNNNESCFNDACSTVYKICMKLKKKVAKL